MCERDRLRRMLLAEALGTAIYVFVSAGAFASARIVAHSTYDLSAQSWVVIAFGHGLAYFIGVAVSARVSHGHINPAITIGFAAVGRFPRRHMVVQVLAQLAGAGLGGLGVLLIYGHSGVTIGRLGAETVQPGIGLAQGFGIEAIGTFVFALVLLSARSASQAGPILTPLASGLAITALTLAIGPATGASMNPARSFGPAVVDVLSGASSDWATFIVIRLCAPVAGALVASILFVNVAAPAPQDAL